MELSPDENFVSATAITVRVISSYQTFRGAVLWSGSGSKRNYLSFYFIDSPPPPPLFATLFCLMQANSRLVTESKATSVPLF